MGVAGSMAKTLGPAVTKLAPDVTSGFVHEALHRAIHGVGPLPGAASAADKQLEEQKGNVEDAIHEVLENHVGLALVEGFATNVGGLVTAAVTIPANIAGLALLQCRMIAGIAHLRGYDLHDPRVKDAIMACMLGEDGVKALVKKKKLPAPPMAIATAPVHDPRLDKVVAAEVTSDMLKRMAGKRLVTSVGRKVPIVGGLIGAGADGFSTWQLGRYAARELRPRAIRG
jgi:hypothetical protein